MDAYWCFVTGALDADGVTMGTIVPVKSGERGVVMDRITVMDDVERERRLRESVLDDQLRAVRTHALDSKHPERYDAVRGVLQRILQPAGPAVKTNNRAFNRRLELENAFHSVGLLVGVSIPMPLVKGKEIPNREFARREKKGQALFVQPPKHLWTYESHMIAFGQGTHWTVTDADARAKIAWEPTDDWRWFWAEVECGKNNKEDCPRLNTSWNNLTKKIRLLSLEEYVLVWHLHKAITGKKLDISTWTWLRTRWNVSGALYAVEFDGEVFVDRDEAEVLSIAYDFGGGRAQEVVTTAS